jgi:hypothetical protein
LSFLKSDISIHELRLSDMNSAPFREVTTLDLIDTIRAIGVPQCMGLHTTTRNLLSVNGLLLKMANETVA